MVRVIETSKVFQDGKTVIPTEVRSKLDIKKDGDTVVWIEDDKRVYVASAEGAAAEMQLMKPHWIEGWPKGKGKEP